jgi:ectoine hydroxylase-related dioxygenase (phytanoyl-CoA dioxygenase family)
VTLLPEQLAEYRARGFVVLRGRVSPEECAALRAEVSRLIEIAAAERRSGRRDGFWEQMPRSRRAAEVFFEEGEPFEERRVMRVGHGLHCAPGPFETLARGPVIGTALASVVPAPARIVSSAVVYKQPQSDAVQFGFHQDAAYLTYSPPILALAFLALDPCDAASGALQVVPGSHTRGVDLRLRLGPKGFEAASGREARFSPADAELLEMDPGDVVLVDGCTYHASDPNRSAAPRRAVIVHATGGGAVAEGTTWMETDAASNRGATGDME